MPASLAVSCRRSDIDYHRRFVGCCIRPVPCVTLPPLYPRSAPICSACGASPRTASNAYARRARAYDRRSRAFGLGSHGETELSTVRRDTTAVLVMAAEHAAVAAPAVCTRHLRIPQPKTRKLRHASGHHRGTDKRIQCHRASPCWRSSASGLPGCCWGSSSLGRFERAVYFFERCLAFTDAARPFLAMGVCSRRPLSPSSSSSASPAFSSTLSAASASARRAP